MQRLNFHRNNANRIKYSDKYGDLFNQLKAAYYLLIYGLQEKQIKSLDLIQNQLPQTKVIYCQTIEKIQEATFQGNGYIITRVIMYKSVLKVANNRYKIIFISDNISKSIKLKEFDHVYQIVSNIEQIFTLLRSITNTLKHNTYYATHINSINPIIKQTNNKQSQKKLKKKKKKQTKQIKLSLIKQLQEYKFNKQKSMDSRLEITNINSLRKENIPGPGHYDILKSVFNPKIHFKKKKNLNDLSVDQFVMYLNKISRMQSSLILKLPKI